MDLFYSGVQLYVLLSPYPFNTYISFSYLVMYVLRDDASISNRSFMQIKVRKGANMFLKGYHLEAKTAPKT